METPSSTRRVTRSQTLASANKNNNIPMSKKIEESEKGVTKSRQRNGKQQQQQQDRSALIDITNDSPIVGLAMGSGLETPSSAMSKKRLVMNGKAKYGGGDGGGTPGSGEALLRGQVKTLLQKVEEEAELSKLSLENRPFLHLQGIVNSPLTLLAPTPANTPQVLNLSANGSSQIDGLDSVTQSPVEDKFVISQMVSEILFEGKKQEGVVESEKDFVTRSLLLDFSEKSEGCDSSESKDQKMMMSSTDDDDASIWSMQVNASSSIRDDDDEEEEDEEGTLEKVEEDCYDDYGYDYDYEEGEEEEDDDIEGLMVDELCEGMSKMNVNGGRKMAKFGGKHKRFVYNSDGELEGEEEDGFESATPKGKHLRFHEEYSSDEED